MLQPCPLPCQPACPARPDLLQAAASRLVELKTAQVARMRQELLIAQTQELAEVHKVYEEETRKFHTAWETRVKVWAGCGKSRSACGGVCEACRCHGPGCVL